jgi:DNA-binding NarL/FixJ family response regulator
MSVSPTVLLIDDSPEDRVLYRRFLCGNQHSAYNIVETGTAIEGLNWCKHSRPDVILLDYCLPDLTGLEVLAELRLQFGDGLMPVVMLTGQGDESIAVQAMKQGVQDYLVKGQLSPDVLDRTLHSAITQFRLQQQLVQQQQQQQVITAIALRVCQSLSLQEILATTVAEVRQLLNADRVLMYQLAANSEGKVVAESVVAPWSACLDEQIEDQCFYTRIEKDYKQGRTRAIDHIYEAGLTDCHVEMLERFQVKANLVVPILIGSPTDRLWGLLIAHQCHAPRTWQASETELLQQLAVQIAIALQQAELYEQLETLNTQLEERVQTRSVATGNFAASGNPKIPGGARVLFTADQCHYCRSSHRPHGRTGHGTHSQPDSSLPA